MRLILWCLLTWCLLTGGALASGWQTFLAPGPVHQHHDDVAANCDACHLNFQGVPDNRCARCHIPIAARQLTKEGFHGAVADQPCIACHTDHNGLSGSLTRPSVIDAFDHAATGFPLAGDHLRADCEDCHKAAIGEVKPVCGDCHASEDIHESALGADCGSCHFPTKWSVLLKDRDSHKVSLEGGHSELSCTDCHQDGAALEPDVSCAVCHEQGHGGTDASCDRCHQVTGFLPATFDHGPCTCSFPGKHQSDDCVGCHVDMNFTNTPTLCSGCHDSDRTHQPLGECSSCHTALSWSENRFDHNRSSSFPITGAHLAVSCSQCHPTAGQFLDAPKDCAGCHQEIGAAAHGDFGACESCHGTEGWRPSTFDHASTGFPLAGKHETLGCQDCHPDKTEGYPGR